MLVRRDIGEIIQVTGYDDHSRTIEVQTSDGDLDEIEGELWREIPLELVEPPEHWSGPVDDIGDGDDPGDTDSWTGGLAPMEPRSRRRKRHGRTRQPRRKSILTLSVWIRAVFTEHTGNQTVTLLGNRSVQTSLATGDP
jgi:hypothetical protein